LRGRNFSVKELKLIHLTVKKNIMEGVIGYVTMFAGNFAPRAWAFCAGQIMPIAQNTALFSILGTTYGGNGQTTFGLPDLRGRAVVSAGQGPGLSFYQLGQVTGTETQTLISGQMAAHVHPTSVVITPAAATNASTSSPQNGVYANSTESLYNSTGDTSMQQYNGALTTGIIGSSQAFPIVNPYLALNYVICLQGVFPARN
jgi:microcystin-dependent protein